MKLLLAALILTACGPSAKFEVVQPVYHKSHYRFYDEVGVRHYCKEANFDSACGASLRSCDDGNEYSCVDTVEEVQK